MELDIINTSDNTAIFFVWLQVLWRLSLGDALNLVNALKFIILGHAYFKGIFK